jgi:FMN-dependent NADH-azoreductase
MGCSQSIDEAKPIKKTLLVITDSPMGDYSASKKVTAAFVEAFKVSNPNFIVETLDLATTPAPDLRVQGKFALYGDGKMESVVADEWKATKALVDQFCAADAYVFASSMWNFGITYQLKRYIDNIVQPQLTFNPINNAGLVTGRPALVIAASGSDLPEMSYGQTNYLQTILGFIGFTDVRLIRVAGTANQEQLAGLLETKSKEAAAAASAFSFDADAKLTSGTAPTFTRAETKISGSKKVLVVTSSPMGDYSASSNATRKAIAALSESDQQLTFEYLDLHAQPAPEFTAARVMAKFALYQGPLEGQENEEFKSSQALIDQFTSADAYIFAVPMWNLGIPYNLKKYIDNIVQPGLTFDPATFAGLVTGPAIVIAASGSGLLGTPMDHVTSYMQTILGFVGIKDVQTVFINGTADQAQAPALIEGAATQAATIFKGLL